MGPRNYHHRPRDQEAVRVIKHVFIHIWIRITLNPRRDYEEEINLGDRPIVYDKI